MEKLHKFFIYWFPILIYCLLIYIQSSYPSPQSLPDIPYMDKVLHVTAYALLGALFLRAFKASRIKHNFKLAITISILLASLYGISDELHQYFVPTRTADIMDVMADILGIVMGVSIYHMIVR